jgi:glycosyltransferase involved in cell wall biosynthesis
MGGVKVLHIVTRFKQGGAERDIIHWVNCEMRLGHEVALICGSDSETTNVPTGVRVETVDSLVRGPNPVLDVRAVLTLRRRIAAGLYDVVYTHQSKAGILGRLAARGHAPRVVHTIHMASFGSGYGRIWSWLFERAERACASFTDEYICVGEDIRRRYVANGIAPAERFHTARTPIELERYFAVRSLSSEKRMQLRAKFDLPAEGSLAVCIGALEKRKRHELVLQELAPGLRAGRMCLAIAGTGPERVTLARTAAALGIADRIRILGHVVSPEDLLGCADVLVHGSAVEGVCRVFVEAAAAGVPVVATDVDGAREVPGVTVVARNGAGLGTAVAEVLDRRPTQVHCDELSPWLPSSVSSNFATFQEKLGINS